MSRRGADPPTTILLPQQTIRELFDMAPEEPGRREPEKEKDKEKDKDRDGDVPPDEDEDPAATRRTHILEQVGTRVTLMPPRVPWWPRCPPISLISLVSTNLFAVPRVS